MPRLFHTSPGASHADQLPQLLQLRQPREIYEWVERYSYIGRSLYSVDGVGEGNQQSILSHHRHSVCLFLGMMFIISYRSYYTKLIFILAIFHTKPSALFPPSFRFISQSSFPFFSFFRFCPALASPPGKGGPWTSIIRLRCVSTARHCITLYTGPDTWTYQTRSVHEYI